MRCAAIIGIAVLLLLITGASADTREDSKISIFGINDLKEIEWRFEATMDELAKGIEFPANNNATSVLIVYKNYAVYQIKLNE
ncbi:MAG: hypothetical protein AABX74_06555 [Nanoarchaeota archaeon]